MSAAAQPKAKKTASSKKPLSHPPFAVMIIEAIASLKERTGSSQYAITKFIEGKHKELPPTFKKLILLHLKKSVAAGKLVKVKNSFKLAPVTRPATGKDTPAPTAVKKPKAVSKPTAKADSKPKPKPKPKAAAKPKAVAKPKAKATAAGAKPKAKAKATKVTAGKKAAAKPAKKTPVKTVKKPKSVKSPAKKAKK